MTNVPLPGAKMHSLLRHCRGIEPSGRYFRALSELYEWASRAEPLRVLLRTLGMNIRAIDVAMSQRSDPKLNLPDTLPYASKDAPPTLVQQYCDTVASVFAAAANNLGRADGVEAHLAALNQVFQGAKELWNSDDAAARYLERPSVRFGGQAPLALARQTLTCAQQAVAAIKAARTEVAKANDVARDLAAARPRPTVDTVSEAARDLLGDRALAKAFLVSPHPLLGDQAPLDVAKQSADGAACVDRLIRQARAGTAI